MAEPEFKPFTCSECGGTVELHTGPGRTMELYRGVPELPVHPKFAIPRCRNCGETYVLAHTEDALESMLCSQFDMLVWRRLEILEQLVRSRLSKCSCGQPATRILHRPTAAKDVLSCDQCRKGLCCSDLPQAAALRALAQLEGRDGD